MKPKEIHDLLLSLFCRGIGFWLLYGAAQNFPAMLTEFMSFFDATANKSMMAYDYAHFGASIAAAIYLILGAPPLLKWATRNRD